MDNLTEQAWFQTHEELRDSVIDALHGQRLWRRLALAGWLTVLVLMIVATVR